MAILKRRKRHEAQSESPENILDIPDSSLIGRSIKLVRAENWQDDIIRTSPKETHILYENQRGWLFWGKPYFSANSLVQSFKFDPPPHQRTNTFLTCHPGTTDPSEPGNTNWPPDPERLYYSPYSPSSGILAMDSATGHAWEWKQDRWYVDMRGDVDDEGWEYAFYWNGRYWWCGGNWHGKHVWFHGWVRRRRWVRDMQRKHEKRETVCPANALTQVPSTVEKSGGLEGLLSTLRQPQSPTLKSIALKEYFDHCLETGIVSLPSYIHRIYILLDPISTRALIHILQQINRHTSPECLTALQSSLTYLQSKLPPDTNKLPIVKSHNESDWHTLLPTNEHPTRRTRLHILREQWLQSRQSPARLVRKVRFTDDSPDEEFVNAPESLKAIGRSLSNESREEWFVAPEDPGESVQRSKSVSGLLRAGMSQSEQEAAVVDRDVHGVQV